MKILPQDFTILINSCANMKFYPDNISIAMLSMPKYCFKSRFAQQFCSVAEGVPYVFQVFETRSSIWSVHFGFCIYTDG